MQTILIINAHKTFRVKLSYLKKKVKHLLKAEGCKSKSVNIILSDNPYLRQLNKKFKKKNYATNVLAFSFNEPNFLGEIYISLEKVKVQSKALGTAFYSELWTLVVHGLLHLLGYMHKTIKHRRLMEKTEAKYL